MKQMRTIQIWPGLSSLMGPEPHWMFKDDQGVMRRLCDGAIWREGDSVPGKGFCDECTNLYVYDLMQGGARLAYFP